MSWWDLWKTKSKDYLYVEIPADHTASNLAQQPLIPKAGYLRIFLKSWRIDSIREGWSQFFGAVHGYASVPRFGQGLVEVDAFTSPNQLQNADPRHANRVLSLNFPLFGPAPYMGGDLNLRVGLFSIKSGDLAGPFLDVLTQLASVAGAGAYAAAAQPFLEPLKKGIEAITGCDQSTRLEIGLVKCFNKPVTGSFAVIRAEAGQIDASSLRIDSDGLLVDGNGDPVQDFPYFVFTIEWSAQHEAWWEIPALAEAYEALTAIVEDDNVSDTMVLASFLRFRKKVKLLPDLIPADAERVLAEVKARIADLRATGADGTTSPRLGTVSYVEGKAIRPVSFQAASPMIARMPPLNAVQIYEKPCPQLRSQGRIELVEI